jgi:fatty acid synthase subunit alpha, fungi type
MRETKSSLTKLLCELIFTKPIHWTKASSCNFPETVTHALDFGHDGLSGCGPTAAHSLDGHGRRVVIVGNKSKGTVELFDGQNIRYEEWWGKKYNAGSHQD